LAPEQFNFEKVWTAPQGFACKSLPPDRGKRALPAVSELFQALIAIKHDHKEKGYAKGSMASSTPRPS
jgi:hypothetical protein